MVEEENSPKSEDANGSLNPHYRKLVRTVVRGPWRTHGRQRFKEEDVLQRLHDLEIDPAEIDDYNFADIFRRVTAYYGRGSTYGSGAKEGSPRRGLGRITGRKARRRRY
jgi:hypothetical protein